MKTIVIAIAVLFAALVTCDATAADPNVYWGGVHAQPVNVAAAFGVDNTNTTDACPRLQMALGYLVKSGQAAWMPAGTYKCATPVTVPSNAIILGSPTTIIDSVIVPTQNGDAGVNVGGYANSVFLALLTYGSSPAASTLASTPVLGSNTLSSNALYPAGTLVVVTQAADSGFIEQQFTVKATSGTGPYTLTVDDPTQYQFAGGDVIQVGVPPQNILIDGITFTGTGDRAVELSGAWNSVVRNCSVNDSAGTFTSIVMSFDIAGRHNTFDNIVIDENSQAGLALETNQFSTIRNSIVRRVNGSTSSVGYYLPSTTSSLLDRDVAVKCNYGMECTQSENSAVDPGCVDVSVTNSSFLDNVTYGIIQSSGLRVRYLDVAANNNVDDGIDIFTAAPSPPSLDILLSNFTTSNNGNNGVDIVNNAGARVFASNLSSTGNTTSGVALSSTGAKMSIAGASTTGNGVSGLSVSGTVELTANGWTSVDEPQPWATTGTAPRLVIKASRARNVALNGLWTPLPSDTGGEVVLDDYVAEYVAGTGTKALYDADGTTLIKMRNVRTIGALTYGPYQANSAGTTGYMLQDCDFTSAGTPFAVDAADPLNMAQGQGLYTNSTTSGTVTLTMVQAQVSSMKFTQTLANNLTYNVPAGIGGLFYNVDASGVTLSGHTLSVGVTGGSAVSLSAAQHIVYSDGTNAHTVL